METWRDVVGYEDIFMISDQGNMYSKRSNKNLKQFKTKKGYLTVSTKVLGVSVCFRVHRVVAEAFIENPLCLQEVNHKDLDKVNNKVDNLEWVSSKENTEHAIVNGVHKLPTKVKVVSDIDRDIIRNTYKPRDSVFGCRALARKYGVSHKTIQKILTY